MTLTAEASSPSREDEQMRPQDMQYAPIVAKLREWNLDYTVDPHFPIANIAVHRAAQVRETAHVAPTDRIEEYRQQMSNGAVFPPVLLRKVEGKNVPLLIDGNTRLAAARKIGRKTFPAIIVDTKTPEMALILAAAVNQMGGERLSASEAHTAALLMMQQGYPDGAIARELGRDLSQVRRWRNQQDVLKRAETLGLAEQAKLLSAGALGKLADVRHEEPFVELTRLFADVRPGEKQAKEMVSQVVQATSDDDAVKVVQALREELAPAGPPPHAANKGSNTIGLVRAAIGNLVKLSGRAREGFDPAKRAEELERWQKLRQVCDEMLEALRS